VLGDGALVTEPTVLGVLGIPGDSITLGRLWSHLLDMEPPDDPAGEWTAALETILGEGPLARRMLKVAGAEPSRADLRGLAETLCGCLLENRPLSTGGV